MWIVQLRYTTVREVLDRQFKFAPVEYAVRKYLFEKKLKLSDADAYVQFRSKFLVEFEFGGGREFHVNCWNRMVYDTAIDVMTRHLSATISETSDGMSIG